MGPGRGLLAAAAVAGLLLAAGRSSEASPPDPGAFTLQAASVSPSRAYFDGRAPVTIRYRFRAGSPSDVEVRLVRLEGGRTVWGTERRGARPGVTHSIDWPGVSWAGRPAPDGQYRVEVGEAGQPLRAIDTFEFRGHIFPVRGPHGTRGPIGDFGAPRSGGRTHEGFDVVAACGTPVLAARGGRVLKARYDPVLDGNYVVIHGRGERRAYLYAHLRKPVALRRGDVVRTGRRIGSVGKTGNAVTVGCHLHFELHVRGRPIDPEPYLRAWDRYS